MIAFESSANAKHAAISTPSPLAGEGWGEGDRNGANDRVARRISEAAMNWLNERWTGAIFVSKKKPA